MNNPLDILVCFIGIALGIMSVIYFMKGNVLLGMWHMIYSILIGAILLWVNYENL